MYKEEVFEELKKHDEFKEYTMEACRQDLDVLILWKNLMAVQHTAKVTTVEEFKNKQFRYELSEYSVEIDRLTIKLENLFIESDSLEPSLLERIKEHIEKLLNITNEIIRKITRFASQIADSRNSASNRREEYRKLCSMFLKCKDIEEAHKLSAVGFGIFSMKHIKEHVNRITESINSGIFEEQSYIKKSILEFEVTGKNQREIPS